jgi:hypothetical protein
MSPDDVAIVSGLPRSGTSMMMRMIAAGGVPVLGDGLRAADEDNPLGYFEYEPVKATRRDAGWVPGARGKVVKIVHALLTALPDGYRYRVVMMHRDLDEVLASQAKMLARGGHADGAAPPHVLKRAYASQLRDLDRWLDERPQFERLDVHYDEVVADPAGQAERVAAFLDLGGRSGAMAAAVDSTLYRNRANI